MYALEKLRELKQTAHATFTNKNLVLAERNYALGQFEAYDRAIALIAREYPDRRSLRDEHRDGMTCPEPPDRH